VFAAERRKQEEGRKIEVAKKSPLEMATRESQGFIILPRIVLPSRLKGGIQL